MVAMLAGERPAMLQLLRRTAEEASSQQRDNVDHELQTMEHMAIVHRRLQETKAKVCHPSFQVIPTFYHKHTPPLPGGGERPQSAGGQAEAKDRTDIRQRMKTLARTRFLRRKEASLPDDEDITILGRILQSVQSTPLPSGEEAALHGTRCNYDDYCQLRDQVPEATRRLFTVQAFLKFPRDKHGRVSNSDLLRHFYNTVLMEKTKLTLSLYAQDGEGFLMEPDLEAYIFDLILHSPLSMDYRSENFWPFYVFTAVRRFMFFLDRRKTGKISINKLMRSRVMEELMDLAMISPQAEQDLEVSDTFLRQQRGKNWFSSTNALRVYSMYLDLDTDHNGLLSRRELLGYVGSTSTVRLTPAFVDRLFEENITYRLADSPTGEAEMDYKVFLDFVLAMENKTTPQALHYFFRMLDVEKKGGLTASSIRYFFRDVARRMAECGFDPPKIDDVKDEIFDMAHPQDRALITIDDFLECGVGGIIVSILSDVNGFLAYDNRENILYAGNEQDEDPDSA